VRPCAHLLLVRRSIADPSRIACFAVHARIGTPVGESVRVMGLRRSQQGAPADPPAEQHPLRPRQAVPGALPYPRSVNRTAFGIEIFRGLLSRRRPVDGLALSWDITLSEGDSHGISC
jgi:hypothetical protein